MGTTTAISWTDHTFSPWWGCARVSDGCRFCYAEGFAKRVGDDVWGKGAPRRAIGDKTWNDPLRWDREAEAAGVPARVFCASMCDVFEDHDGPMVDHHGDLLPSRSVAQERRRLWELIVSTPNLRWQLLTKRPENVARLVPAHWLNPPVLESAPAAGSGSPRGRTSSDHPCWPYNVWIGTTTEHQATALERLPHLLALPAPVRFLSYEPALGPLDLGNPGWLTPMATVCHRTVRQGEDPAALGSALRAMGTRLGWHGIDWVICGGESGPKRRPFDLGWARSVRDQCAAAGVAFFFKQDGGLRAGTPGPADLEAHKAFPAAP